MKIFGYCRISTMKQNIQRQIDNIKSQYPDALIITEEYTGTKIDRPEFSKLMKKVKSGDTIVFDEVSRMSRDAEEGFKLYEELFDKGVNLIFIKEPHINTSVYRDKLDKQIEKINSTGNKATDKLLASIMDALHEFTIDLAKEQIELAFQTAQAEVDFLHKRTSEGVQRAILNGKKVGGLTTKGTKLTTKKSIEMKRRIKELSKDFGGKNTDSEVISITKLARNTYYKYKAEIKAELYGGVDVNSRLEQVYKINLEDAERFIKMAKKHNDADMLARAEKDKQKWIDKLESFHKNNSQE